MYQPLLFHWQLGLSSASASTPLPSGRETLTDVDTVRLGAPPIPRSPPEPALVNLQTPSTVVRQWEEPRTALLADALWINYVLLRGQSLSSFLSNIPWNDNDDRAPSSQLVRSGAFTNSIKVLLSRSMQCAHVDCTRKSKKLYDTNVMCGKGTAQTLY